MLKNEQKQTRGKGGGGSKLVNPERTYFLNASLWKLEILQKLRSSHPEVFPGKSVLEICSKLTGEHSCRTAVSTKLQSNFIEIALRHGCSPVNLLHVFRTLFLQNTSRWLLLKAATSRCFLHVSC